MTGSTPDDGGPAELPEVGSVPPADAGLAVVYHLPFGGAPGQVASRAEPGREMSGVASGVATAEAADDVSDTARVVGEDSAREDSAREDWAWVREWRDGQEPTPWLTGIPLAVFSALVVGVAVWVLSAGLADRPILAVLVNLLVAGGLTPAMWLSRNLPVLRWIAAGAAAGIAAGWIGAILMLPVPPV